MTPLSIAIARILCLKIRNITKVHHRSALPKRHIREFEGNHVEYQQSYVIFRKSFYEASRQSCFWSELSIECMLTKLIGAESLFRNSPQPLRWSKHSKFFD